ncbi:hypothetical protein ES703_82173 [subsurface metagenome]
MKTEREILKNRWLTILTPEQRGAWSIYVSQKPVGFTSAILSDRTGQLLYIACNLQIRK